MSDDVDDSNMVTTIAGTSGATYVRLLESVPTTWDDSDICFFACVFDLFPQAFTLGASVLLASYDDSVAA